MHAFTLAVICLAAVSNAQKIIGFPIPKGKTGIILDTLGCSADQTRAMEQALVNLNYLVNAAFSSFYTKHDPLFPYLFQPGDRSALGTALANYHQLKQGKSPSVVFTCRDVESRCSDNLMGYVPNFFNLKAGRPNMGLAIFCPLSLNRTIVPVLDDPCDNQPSGTPKSIISLTLLLWHELLMQPFFTGNSVATLQQGDSAATTPIAAYQLNVDAGAGNLTGILTPRTNLQSYVFYVSWAFIREQQRLRCPARYKDWDVLYPTASNKKDELRRLLSILPDNDAEVANATAANITFAPSSSLSATQKRINGTVLTFIYGNSAG